MEMIHTRLIGDRNGESQHSACISVEIQCPQKVTIIRISRVMKQKTMSIMVFV